MAGTDQLAAPTAMTARRLRWWSARWQLTRTPTWRTETGWMWMGCLFCSSFPYVDIELEYQSVLVFHGTLFFFFRCIFSLFICLPLLPSLGWWCGISAWVHKVFEEGLHTVIKFQSWQTCTCTSVYTQACVCLPQAEIVIFGSQLHGG